MRRVQSRAAVERTLKSMPMVVMNEVVKLSSEKRSRRQLLPTPAQSKANEQHKRLSGMQVVDRSRQQRRREANRGRGRGSEPDATDGTRPRSARCAPLCPSPASAIAHSLASAWSFAAGAEWLGERGRSSEREDGQHRRSYDSPLDPTANRNRTPDLPCVHPSLQPRARCIVTHPSLQ